MLVSSETKFMSKSHDRCTWSIKTVIQNFQLNFAMTVDCSLMVVGNIFLEVSLIHHVWCADKNICIVLNSVYYTFYIFTRNLNIHIYEFQSSYCESVFIGFKDHIHTYTYIYIQNFDLTHLQLIFMLSRGLLLF